MSGIVRAQGYIYRRPQRGVLSTVLENGIGRPVKQLQRLTLKFCETHCKSFQTRLFVEEQLISFAAKHPSVVVYALPETDSLPQVCAEYLNGRQEVHELQGKDCEDILTMLEELAFKSGLELIEIKKDSSTKYPSMQGQWHPFTHKKEYDITKSLDYSTKLVNAWDPLGQPWKNLYRKNELHKLESRPKLTFEEKINRPLGKWGPVLPPRY